MLGRKLYNLGTWIWHKVLRAPIKMKVEHDTRTKDAELTIIFLHGISASSKTWFKTIKEIEKDPDLVSVRCIALDLLGFGKSLRADWLSYDYNCYEKVLSRTLRGLKIDTPVILAGHSMGSLIWADYAVNVEKPVDVQGMILVSAPVLMASEMAGLPDKVYNYTYGSLHKFATDVPAADVIAHTIQKFSSFQSKFLKTAAFQKTMDNIILNHHNYKTFTEIKVPTLLLHGRFDALVMGANLRRVAKNNSKYIKYASVTAHHDITSTKRVRILREIKKELKDARQAKSL